MTSSEVRLAETFDLFYSAAGLQSEGAMAGHAYKRAVDDLDSGVGRDLVRRSATLTSVDPTETDTLAAFWWCIGRSLQTYGS
jgi:hypothetical protein